MSSYRIPFNRPSMVGRELEYFQSAVARGHLSGDGYFSRNCQQFLEDWFDSPRALLTPSCTHALELSALLADIQPGDEVILPSFTFPSTANAFALRGARLAFADIRRDTLNIDETLVESLITPRTRALCVVHYAGVGCEMDSLQAIAARHDLHLIEDNAQGLFGRYRGRKLGTFGATSCLSFHETKNISCGEGGALIINDPSLIERAEIIREKGTNRSQFFRGEVQKYTWVDIGSSYLPSELQSAFLWAQLEQSEEIQERRGNLWATYFDGLSPWASEHAVLLPKIPADCEQPYHIFYMLLPDTVTRQKLIEHLKRAGILAVFHYQPLHSSRMGRRFGAGSPDCPVTVWASERLLRLPLYYSLSDAEQREVIEAIINFEVDTTLS